MAEMEGYYDPCYTLDLLFRVQKFRYVADMNVEAKLFSVTPNSLSHS